ncbi:hypothetical protein [Intestinibacter bartlettii]|jgi:hypothetical protein|uniref:hypothetical protein n=1 Tax=Intestinibacter bartlettii TaxID=261299 RepID=UPI0011062297|nr:hypothetical protein [Intestinibacter bartlettii]
MKKIVEFTLQEASDLEDIFECQIIELTQSINGFKRNKLKASTISSIEGYEELIERCEKARNINRNLLKKIRETKITN